MITVEAKMLADEIYSDVIALEITNDKRQRVAIAKLVAQKLKEVTEDAVYHHVINHLNDRLVN